MRLRLSYVDYITREINARPSTLVFVLVNLATKCAYTLRDMR